MEPSKPADAVGDQSESPDKHDLIDALNSGMFKRALDAAVDWDPELTV
jgi:hypothetical protein